MKEWINEGMNKKMNERMNERINVRMNERKKDGVVWIVNCESQTYRTLKQRYCNGLVNICTNTLEIVNIYTVIQEQWIFTLWWSDEWMNEWKKMNERINEGLNEKLNERVKVRMKKRKLGLSQLWIENRKHAGL